MTIDAPTTTTAAPEPIDGSATSWDDELSGPLVFLGLDGEMSGPALDRGARLIQAGLALSDGDGYQGFCATISWPSMAWDERAASVHGLDRQVIDASPPCHDVDAQAARWLREHLANVQPGSRQRVVSVGFNVAAFDHVFFEHALPETMTLVARRAVELNSLFFLLDGSPSPVDGRHWSWGEWKSWAKCQAAAELDAYGLGGREHDAGYDAMLALAVFKCVRSALPGLRSRS